MNIEEIKEASETNDAENNMLENTKKILFSKKKDNGGDTIEETIENSKEKMKIEIPQNMNSEEINELKEKNIKESNKDSSLNGKCKNCDCILF